MPDILDILTFNWHEPYIWLLAKTGHRFDVAEPSEGRGAIRRWNHNIRPMPPNLNAISMETAIEKVKSGRYDAAICHNFHDIKKISAYRIPAVLVFHNKLTTELALGGNTIGREKYLSDVAPLVDRADVLVFVSESKKGDWVFEGGKVIKPGVDIDDLISYKGHDRKILRVGNYMKERDIMLGYTLQESVCERFNCTVVGHNPAMSQVRPAESFGELKNLYASHRVYLNTTLAPYEDGYNLAMLEAMACGAPIVSFENPTSPLENGVNGFISGDIHGVRAAISSLMSDRETAARIGGRGRETVRRLFGIEAFLSGWNEALDMARQGGGGGRGVS